MSPNWLCEHVKNKNRNPLSNLYSINVSSHTCHPTGFVNMQNSVFTLGVPQNHKIFHWVPIHMQVQCWASLPFLEQFSHESFVIIGWRLLTHLPWTKWLQFCRQHLQRDFPEWKVLHFIWIWLDFVPKGPIDNKPVLGYIMAWRRIGDRPLPEPMLTRFNDIYRGKWVNSNTIPLSDTDSHKSKFQWKPIWNVILGTGDILLKLHPL